MLGKGEIAGGKSYRQQTRRHGENSDSRSGVELNINGTIDGDTMKGVINSGIPGFPPLPFEGKREGSTAQTAAKTDDKMPVAAKGSIAGKWKIDTNANGQSVTVNVDFKQDGDKLSGTITSDIGGGTVKSGTVSGKKVKAALEIDFQGQPLEVTLDGNLDGDGKMSGTLTPQIPGIGELAFTGTKVN